MYAPFDFFGFAVVGGFGAGQVNPVQWATTAFTKEAAKRTITLPSTGTIRYWFNDTRPGRPTQGYAGMAG
jgi:hypothetical protein